MLTYVWAMRHLGHFLSATAYSLAIILAPLDSFALLARAEDRAATPRLLILDQSELDRAKRRAQGGDAAVVPALQRLQDEAERHYVAPNYSVMQKTALPPSGDKHDYMSLAPYWWPNPNTPSRLPYIRRDGRINPERDAVSDRKRLGSMIQAVKTLALAHFFTEEDKYARRANELLRVWFLDSATNMNPRLNYAQAVPGVSRGRGAGIIETHDFPDLLDAVQLLTRSRARTEPDHKQLQRWFADYLSWLLESPHGREAAQSRNNHGSWYDVQVASYALFFGDEQLAKTVLGKFAAKRIGAQVEPEGRQPHELARARAWHYSIFNLEAFFKAALLAEKVGIDLWNTEANNRSMRRALDWLIPFATAEKKWPGKEIAPFEPQKLASLLRMAAIRYREPAYEKALGKVPNITGTERWQLLYPSSPK